MTRHIKPRLLYAKLPLLALLIIDCALAALAIASAESARHFLYFHAGLVGVLLCLALAIVFLRDGGLGAPFKPRAAGITLASLLLFTLLLDLADASVINDLAAIVHRRFQQPAWFLFGLLLAALAFLPILADKLRQCLRGRNYADLAVAGGLLLMLYLLQLPIGLDSVGHWESWIYWAQLEGLFSWSVNYELTTRFWVALPHQLAVIISPASFTGFHLTRMLIHWLMLLAFYGILKKLRFPRYAAFLAVCLCLCYPVNSDLLSLRSLPNIFSAMALLLAGWLALEIRGHPSRPRMLALWLALSFNVASNETAYALILLVPLLWLPRRPSLDREAIKLAAIWYLAPASKLAYLALLAGLGMRFYNSYVFSGEWNAGGNTLAATGARLLDVYAHTLVEGWASAITAFSQSDWLGMSALICIVAAGLAICLARERSALPSTSELARKLAWGLLFIAPAVGVLVWLEQYSGDRWRSYFYAPIGGSIALLSLAALLSTPIRRAAYRRALIIALCLLACLPGMVRLFEQQARLASQADDIKLMLRSLLEAAPALSPDTRVMFFSDMSSAELDASGIYALRYSWQLDDSILYLLYGAPHSSDFCLTAAPCAALDRVSKPNAPGFSASDFHRTLFFKILPDLNIQLIAEPQTYFAFQRDIAYDISQLYDPNAPPPARALSLLGAAPGRG